MDDYESPLEETPLEFLTSIANSGGDHGVEHAGQAVVPEGDHYRCWCSCGRWSITARDQEQGLAAARAHTAGQRTP
ncbi:hypothetical protein [[Mycobacterium] nativiensis]|uniref:Transposase n=1 Tax=[Mycobacterium] nativiensis TaxID=2855503 RepID=A0ABU5XV68_9MYCO|nr:hypothetical protein [Mycolicibacter sp. MYC340]MEB3031876.1 hypothetical protein [Mycolicibacter sp. MYC340]